MKTKTTIFGLATMLALAMAAIAFAHGGYGSHMGRYGGEHMMGPGYGGHMMGRGYDRGHMMGWDSDDGSYCRKYGARGNLSEEDAARLDKSREKFYNDTRDLREQIDEKEMALSREMDKANPDQNKIFALQKEISSLRSDFDQKAIAHQMEVRRLLPDNYRGSGYGHGHGYCW
jgi:zinc resistance-associated protein